MASPGESPRHRDPVAFLGDTPANSDAFGPHEKIAAAIAEQVLAPEGTCGTIGIIGERGSGKSTVISLLRRKLRAHDHVRVFVFDAWAHENDHLRRAFLEEIADRLCAGEPDGQNGWLERDFADNLKAELAGRKSTSRSWNSSGLTPRGAFLAFTALFVPAGAGLIASAPKGNPARVIGWVLALAPVISGFFLSICRWPQEWSWAAALDVFASKSRSRDTTTTSTSPEPSSLEFRQRFREILGNALNSGRRLLIVLDNLDRLPPGERDRLWSVMRTYLDVLDYESGEGEFRVWTLVPLLPPKASPKTPADGSGNEAACEDPLDRLFFASFVVPQPLLSGWKNFARDLLQKTLPNWCSTDVDAALAYYQGAARSRGVLAPTPRDVKTFVNRIIAIEGHQAFQAERRAIAMLAAIKTTAGEWQPPDVPPPYLPWESSKDLYSEICALYFRTDVTTARQIAFGSEVLTALESADHGAIADIFQQCPDVGATILQVVQGAIGGWRSGRAGLFGAAALALNPRKDDPDVSFALDELADAAMAARGWISTLDTNAANGLAALCERRPNRAGGLISALGGEFAHAPAADALDRSTNGFATLIGSLGIRGIATDALASLKIGSTPAAYLQMVSALKPETGKGALRHLRPACGSPAILELLKERTPAADEVWLWQTRVCAYVDCDWNWTPVMEDIRGRLNSDLPKPAAAALVEFLLDRYRDSPDAVVNALRPARDNGWLFAHLQGAKLGAGIVAIALANPDPNQPPNPPQPSMREGRDLYTRTLGQSPILPEVGRCVLQVGAFRRILTLRSQAKAPVDKLLQGAVAADPNVLTPNDLVDERGTWKEILGVEGYASALLANRAGCVTRVAGRPFQIAESDLCLELISHGDAAAPLRAFLGGGVAAMTADEWTNALTSGGSVLDLCRAGLPFAGLFPAGSGLQDGIRNAFRAAVGGKPIAIQPAEIGKLLNALEANAKEVLRKQTFGAFVQSQASPALAVDFAGIIFAEWQGLPADKFCEGVTTWAERRQEAPLEWAFRALQADPNLSSRIPGPDRNDLANRLANAAENEGEANLRTLFEKLGDALS